MKLHAKRPERPQFSENINIFPGNLIKIALKNRDIQQSKREVFSETPFTIGHYRNFKRPDTITIVILKDR